MPSSPYIALMATFLSTRVVLGQVLFPSLSWWLLFHMQYSRFFFLPMHDCEVLLLRWAHQNLIKAMVLQKKTWIYTIQRGTKNNNRMEKNVTSIDGVLVIYINTYIDISPAVQFTLRRTHQWHSLFSYKIHFGTELRHRPHHIGCSCFGQCQCCCFIWCNSGKLIARVLGYRCNR